MSFGRSYYRVVADRWVVLKGLDLVEWELTNSTFLNKEEVWRKIAYCQSYGKDSCLGNVRRRRYGY